jgi:hypothetical protein
MGRIAKGIAADLCENGENSGFSFSARLAIMKLRTNRNGGAARHSAETEVNAT